MLVLTGEWHLLFPKYTFLHVMVHSVSICTPGEKSAAKQGVPRRPKGLVVTATTTGYGHRAILLWHVQGRRNDFQIDIVSKASYLRSY